MEERMLFLVVIALLVFAGFSVYNSRFTGFHACRDATPEENEMFKQGKLLDATGEAVLSPGSPPGTHHTKFGCIMPFGNCVDLGCKLIYGGTCIKLNTWEGTRCFCKYSEHITP